MARAPLTIHCGLFVDETAERATWHVPLTHALESWSDARAYDGSISLLQPLIEPMFGGRTPLEILVLLDEAPKVFLYARPGSGTEQGRPVNFSISLPPKNPCSCEKTCARSPRLEGAENSTGALRLLMLSRARSKAQTPIASPTTSDGPSDPPKCKTSVELRNGLREKYRGIH